MTRQDYHATVVVKATPQDAIAAINRVQDWWADDFEGATAAVGDRFTVHFGTTFVTFLVKEVIPRQKLLWEVEDCCLPWLRDDKEWNGTQLEWLVATDAGDTQVDLTHIGLQPQIECYANCVKGWDFYAKLSLPKLINEGKGEPDGRKRAVAT